MKVNYPWSSLKPGEGFFVPAIDVEKARELGLRSAVGQRVWGKAVICIKDGLLGVWFFRPPPSPQASAQPP